MKNKLHPGAKWQFRLMYYLTFLFLSFMFIVFFIKNLPGSLLISILIYIILTILISEILVKMGYDRWFYEFTPTNLKIEKGIIWKRYSNIPYERIQNVDIYRGILARIFGFSTIMIQTAGYSYGTPRGLGAEGQIPAVSVKEAEKIRDFLMKKISKKSNQGL